MNPQKCIAAWQQLSATMAMMQQGFNRRVLGMRERKRQLVRELQKLRAQLMEVNCHLGIAGMGGLHGRAGLGGLHGQAVPRMVPEHALSLGIPQWPHSLLDIDHRLGNVAWIQSQYAGSCLSSCCVLAYMQQHSNN